MFDHRDVQGWSRACLWVSGILVRYTWYDVEYWWDAEYRVMTLDGSDLRS